MRKLSAIELSRIELLTNNSIELVLIEPTETGLEKSILDATGPVRSFLREKNLHDYEAQKQGPDNKIQVSAYLVEYDRLLQSVASLYRPVTKKGDPRIWFKGLGNYAKPNDILGVIEFDRKLYVVNLTRIDIQKLVGDAAINPLQDLIREIKQVSNKVADELLLLLRRIALSGPIPALLNADTAIGRTLEMLLGIDINSSKKPDYKGIELKSFRDKRKS
jgi:hypothetical protein